MASDRTSLAEARAIPFIGLPREFAEETNELTGFEAIEQLKELCKWNREDSTGREKERLNLELEAIHHLGLDEFFLGLRDIHRFAAGRGHLAMIKGPAAGSMVVHRLGISPVDPLRHRLLSEFHLDPEQTFPPMRNIGVSGGSNEIVEYARTTYGWEITDENDKPYRAYAREWQSSHDGVSGYATIDVVEHPGLAVIHSTVESILAQRGSATLPKHLSENDPQTWELFQAGDTAGIYAFDGDDAQELLRQIKPARLDQLVAVIAMSRPGSVKAGSMEVYLDRKQDRPEHLQANAQVEEILKETNGVVLYWEQIAELVHQVAGLSRQDGRKLHVALAARKSEQIDHFRDRFLDGAEHRNVVPEVAQACFKQIQVQGPRAICKANAIASAFVAYQMGYLKAHFPGEFDPTALGELNKELLAKM